MQDAYEAGDFSDMGWHTSPREAAPEYPLPAEYAGDPDLTMPHAPLPPPPPPSLPPPELHHTAPELRHAPSDPRRTPADDRMRPDDEPNTTRSIPRADERDADDRDAPAVGQRQVDVERAVPAGQQLRESAGRVVATVRKSIPLRTVLFLLPPLALPALAFDLSATAIVLVWLTLLWLAAAAGVFSTMMLEGNQQVVMRSTERITTAPTSDVQGDTRTEHEMQEALLAIGKQLDVLEERIAALAPTNGVPPVEDLAQTLSHRPQEHWPNPSSDEQYDRYGQTVVPDTDWSESRWRR